MKFRLTILFVFFSILSFGNLANFCKFFIPLGFDNQILLTWQYSAVIGQFPYKDIFYPYGLLSFYKDSNIIFSLIYYFLTPILFTFLYFLFNKIYNQKYFSLLSALLLFLFVSNFTGFDSFGRYGTFIVFSCFVAYSFFFLKNKILNIAIFALGTVCGLIFTLYNDQGLYAGALFTVFLIIDGILSKKFKSIILLPIYALKKLLIFIFGFIISTVPFLIILIKNNSLHEFIYSFMDVVDLEKLAKTPYFHGFLTFDILFTLAMLIFTLTFICYKTLKRDKLNFANYLQISLFLSLIILEQKSIIRHNEAQFSFVALLLLLLLVYEFFGKFKIKEQIGNKIFKLSAAILFILLSVNFYYSLNYLDVSLRCNLRFKIQDKQFTEVKSQLTKDPSFKGNIFSFPADEIFYVIFNQKPPYYPSSFEASSSKAQDTLINYMINNKVNYVIYNYKNIAVQDAVPNIIRSPILNKYILNNFSATKKIGNYLIFKKEENTDFMENNIIEDLPTFKNSLLEVDLRNIPESEGIYKIDQLENNNFIRIFKGSIRELNNFLSDQNSTSENIFLVLNSKYDVKKTSIIITTEEGYITKINFACGSMCIINLNKIPLFYKNRTLSSIELDEPQLIQELSLYVNTGVSDLW